MKNRVTGIMTFIAVVAAFVFGVAVGEFGVVSALRAGQQAQTPSDVRSEFQPFWEVWTHIHERYFDQPVDDTALVRGAIDGMLATLGDRNTVYLSPDEQQLEQEESQGEIQGIGAEVTSEDGAVVIVSPIDGSPAAAAGLQPGDIIRSADGIDLTDMNIGDAAAIVRGPAGTTVVLEIERDGELLTVPVVRDRIKIASVRGELLPEGIAYVRLSRFAEPTADELVDVLAPLLEQDPSGIIVDVRNNPGGALSTVVDVADEFLPGDVRILTERYGDGSEDLFDASREGIAETLPLVVLINEGSASASEVLAGAIRDNGRGILIGAPSFGKGTVQAWLPLSNGGGVRLTIARWLTPDGTWVHETGLTPDIEIPTADDLTAPDAQLDAAVSYLTNGE